MSSSNTGDDTVSANGAPLFQPGDVIRLNDKGRKYYAASGERGVDVERVVTKVVPYTSHDDGASVYTNGLQFGDAFASDCIELVRRDGASPKAAERPIAVGDLVEVHGRGDNWDGSHAEVTSLPGDGTVAVCRVVKSLFHLAVGRDGYGFQLRHLRRIDTPAAAPTEASRRESHLSRYLAEQYAKHGLAPGASETPAAPPQPAPQLCGLCSVSLSDPYHGAVNGPQCVERQGANRRATFAAVAQIDADRRRAETETWRRFVDEPIDPDAVNAGEM